MGHAIHSPEDSAQQQLVGTCGISNWLLTPCVQVLDARDPLRYRSEDLEAFAREAHAEKASLMLLNKADLLPRPLRAAWAAYFQRQGVDFIFWSAKSASDVTGKPVNI